MMLYQQNRFGCIRLLRIAGCTQRARTNQVAIRSEDFHIKIFGTLIPDFHFLALLPGNLGMALDKPFDFYRLQGGHGAHGVDFILKAIAGSNHDGAPVPGIQQIVEHGLD